jgi:SAM-dependent methyltransferase
MSEVIFTAGAGFGRVGNLGYKASDLNRLNARYRVLIEPFSSRFAGARVLDLACHDGRWTYAALKTGAAHVTGIEVRPALIAQASSFITEDMRARCTFIAADIFDQLPGMVRDGASFDIVLCFGVFYHTAEHYRLLSLIAALRPKLILLDTGLTNSAKPIIKLKREHSGLITNVAPMAKGPRDLTVGFPSRGALKMMAADFGLKIQYLPWVPAQHPDHSALQDYFDTNRNGFRRYSAALTFGSPDADDIDAAPELSAARLMFSRPLRHVARLLKWRQ